MTVKKGFHRQLCSTMLVLVVALGTLVAATHAAGPPVFVTNGDDDGEGSLRAALLASGSTTLIKFDQSVADITIRDTLVYSGEGPLTIQGSGQTIVADDDFTLLSATEGAALSISKVSFRGIGGFSASSQGSGKGIFVNVPEDRSGTVHLELDDVSVSDVAYHGIHVSDCDIENGCGNGSGGIGNGSPASIDVSVKRVTVSGVGDAGSLTATASASTSAEMATSTSR